MSISHNTKTLSAMILLVTLTACGGENAAPPPPVVIAPPPPPVAEPIQSRFGAGFEMAFNASQDLDPSSPFEGDIIGLDLNAEPEEIPDQD